MALTINSTKDVYKLAITLWDYLGAHGQTDLAHSLSEKVDDCFSTSNEALEAHKQAFMELKEKQPDLPMEYNQALDKALEILH